MDIANISNVSDQFYQDYKSVNFYGHGFQNSVTVYNRNYLKSINDDKNNFKELSNIALRGYLQSLKKSSNSQVIKVADNNHVINGKKALFYKFNIYTTGQKYQPQDVI